MISFLVGTFIGATLVGSSVQRTLSVGKGQVGLTTFSALMNSASYFFSVYFVVERDIVGYMGTVVGSTLIVMHMAIKNRRIKKRMEDVHKVE